MSKPAAHEYDEQILDLLDGTLSEDKQAELHAWLNASPTHWDRFAHLSFLHSQIAQQLTSQRSSDGVRLDALQAVPELDVAALPPVHLGSSDALTKQQYLSALTYVLKHTFTPKRIAILATAAALLLGVVLTIALMRGDDDTVGESIANVPEPTEPIEDTPAFKPTVATLTNTHNATWAEGALAPGSALRSGQRLTLTTGFAEITTHDGAIAILEAPATIELLDNDNALRLHTGKLVGICETESSKGFLVRTPHMDVTDLGTEFGVEVDDSDQTSQVHVLSGKVRVSGKRGGAYSINLIADQAVKANAAGIETIAYEPARFERNVKLVQLRPHFEGGQSHWLGRPPTDLRIGRQTSEALQVYLEHASLRLDQPLPIDSDEQTPWPPAQLASRQIAAGQTVDVYLLHLDTPGEVAINNRQYILHFDRPILGIIGAHTTLRATGPVLGIEGVRYPVLAKGMKAEEELGLGLDYPDNTAPVDYGEIINNGRSLKLRMTTITNIDQVRVIVASHASEKRTPQNLLNPSEDD